MTSATIIPFQPPLPQALPIIAGNVDYREFRDRFLHLDELLRQSNLETRLLEADLGRWLAGHKRVTPRAQQNHQLHSRRALRCNLARQLLGQEYRVFAARLADSPLLQHFCGLNELGCVKIPGKSTLQRYACGGPKPRCAKSSINFCTWGPPPRRNFVCPKRSIWKAPFWTLPAWRPTSTTRSIGSCCATPPAP